MNLIVKLNNKAQIANDTLHELYEVLIANKADYAGTNAELMRIILDMAAKELKSTHIFEARFKDGSIVSFYGERMPAYVSEQIMIGTALKNQVIAASPR